MTSKIEDGGSAFPKTGSFHEEATAEFDSENREGMTLREYYAGKSLVGMGTWMPAGFVNLNTDEACKARAEFAYRQADAMIAAGKAGAA